MHGFRQWRHVGFVGLWIGFLLAADFSGDAQTLRLAPSGSSSGLKHLYTGAKSLYECPHGKDVNFGTCHQCREEREDFDCQRAKSVLRQNSTYSAKEIGEMSCSDAKINAYVYGFKTTDEIEREARRRRENAEQEAKYKREQEERVRQRQAEHRALEERGRAESTAWRIRSDADRRHSDADRRTSQSIDEANDALRKKVGSGFDDGLGFGDERDRRLQSTDADALEAKAKQLKASAKDLEEKAWKASADGNFQTANALRDRVSLMESQADKAERIARKARSAQEDARAEVSTRIQSKAEELAAHGADEFVEGTDSAALTGVYDTYNRFSPWMDLGESAAKLHGSKPGWDRVDAMAEAADAGTEVVGHVGGVGGALAAGSVQAIAAPIRDATIKAIKKVGEQSAGLIDNPGARVGRGSGAGASPAGGPPPSWASSSPATAPSAGSGANTPSWMAGGPASGGNAASTPRPTGVEPLQAWIDAYAAKGGSGAGAGPTPPKTAPSVRTRYDEINSVPTSLSAEKPPKPVSAAAEASVWTQFQEWLLGKPAPSAPTPSKTSPPVKDLFNDGKTSGDRLRNRYD